MINLGILAPARADTDDLWLFEVLVDLKTLTTAPRLGVEEVDHRQTSHVVVHETTPNHRRDRAACDTGVCEVPECSFVIGRNMVRVSAVVAHGDLALLATDPDRRRELSRVPDEPCIVVGLAGTGLARCWVFCEPSTAPRTRTCAAVDVLLEQVGHEAGGLRSDGAERLEIMLHDRLPSLGDPGDDVGIDSDAIVRDRCIRVGHVKRRDVVHTQRKREHWADV